ncbi:response regulator transcription factor [candidate division KSB1 bacterium]|nr:response regulator transcription factor [candidate division KSB1 bacterium]MBL7092946.1 response regulator transcription factor [candidate division KSB1 bacterium]
MKTILVVEDDIAILRGLRDNLKFEGYKVIEATEGNKGLQLALNENIDLILLDIMLPGLNGYDICRKVKQQKPELPIIMLTARGQEVDKVAGLDLGADDYVSKPFSVPELLARIRAVLRRYNKKERDVDQFSFGEITLDFKKYEATVKEKKVNLSAREFEIMKYFINHANEVVHRHDLLDQVWGYETFPTTRTVDNYILNLRKKFETDPAKPKHILGVHGVGYKFEP